MKQRKLTPVIFFSLLFMLLTSVAACAPVSPVTPQPDIIQQPATFEVSPITLSPSTVMAGDSVTVIATVSNSGDVSGTYHAVLLVDGQPSGSRDIDVAPHSSQGFNFQLIKNAPGSYNLSIGNSTAILKVYGWAPYSLQYDHSDGAAEGVHVNFDQGHLVQFSPPGQVFRIQKIRILAAARIANTYELNNMVTFRIWDKDAGNLLWSQDVPWGNFLSGGWQEVDVPDVRVDGDFRVEVVTHSYAAGNPIDFASMIGFIPIIPKGHIFFPFPGPMLGEVRSAVLVGFDYPFSYIDAPLNRPPTPSGYSDQGKPINPGQKRLEGINWLIRVEGEGISGNQ